MIERIEHLYSLRVLERMGDFPTTCCAAAPDGWRGGCPQPAEAVT
jgi:hypothetical protein